MSDDYRMDQPKRFGEIADGRYLWNRERLTPVARRLLPARWRWFGVGPR